MELSRIRITIISSALGILMCVGASDRAASGRFDAAATQEATSTDSTPACVENMLLKTAEPTSEPTNIDLEMTATLEKPDSGSLLSYLTLEPFDVRFNPKPDNAFAVVMNFTLFVENTAPGNLEVRKPQFELNIEGVPWAAVASTDFQMGTLQTGARQGIVLQTLLLLKKATDAQRQVLECIKAKVPVNLHLTGTLETVFKGKTELAVADVQTDQIVLPMSQ